MKTPLIAIAAAATALTALPASAQDNIVIPYRDLNLQTAEGQKVLDNRIHQAVREFCGYDEIRTGTRARSKEVTNCYREAKAQAKKQFAEVVEAQQMGG